MTDANATPSASWSSPPALAHYVRAEGLRVPRLLLSALANRMAEGLGDEVLRDWAIAVGQDWAQAEQARFAGSGTLDALADSLNSHWAEARWGWARLEETEDGLEVYHHASPLGDAHPSLVGVLEGFYETVFKLLGADDDMVVQLVEGASEGFDLHLRLMA